MISNLPKPDSEFSRKCIAAIGDKLETAKLALSIINKYRCRPLPTKPVCVLDFESLPQKTRNDTWAEIIKERVFLAYQISKKKIEIKNHGSKFFLEELLEIFAEHEMKDEMYSVQRVLGTHRG